jgi:hypothetical protein
MDDAIDYCRQIEAYLCQKNGGHLVRIVGPAFEKVRDWAAQGVPLKVAFRGIDRCVERANARGGRRRPLRIEFCEADVLDTFDAWRRAIGAGPGIGSATSEFEAGQDVVGEQAASAAGVSAIRKGSLAAHIQRSVTRLLAPKGLGVDSFYDETITRITEDLDGLAVRAKNARGDTRSEIVYRLEELDRQLIAAARTRVDPHTAAELRSEADAELAGLAARMPPDVLANVRERAFERLLRDSLNLPVLTYEY